MAGNIDLCIPYIGQGFQYLEYLSRNAKDLATHPDRINLRVSFHTAEDRELLEPIKDRFTSIVQAKTYQDRNILFWPSANHSAAINELAKHCDGDISIFCDYDMVFLRKGWDVELESLESDIAGVPYQRFAMSVETKWVTENMPYMKGAHAVKYQRIPNLSFMVIKKQVLQDVFKGRLTYFDDFLAGCGVPFRIVNSYKLGVANNLPPGVIQWLDTGAEIPEIILDNDLSYTLIDHCGIGILKQYPSDLLNKLTCPEVFELHGKPFLAHFKKGSKKAKTPSGYTWQQFIEDTECAISTLNSTTGDAGQEQENPSIVLAG